MVVLYWEAGDFGIMSHPEVQAVYTSLEEAQLQAEHDLQHGRHPLRIEDATTHEVLWER